MRNTALCYVLESGHEGAAKLLLNTNLELIGMQRHHEVKGLHLAIQREYEDIAKFLLQDNTILPDTVDRSGCTALHAAIRKGCLKVIGLVNKK